MLQEITKNGIPYTWELSGSAGAAFILYPEPQHTEADIFNAKMWLRDNRDVVSIRTATEQDRDELYRAEIFRHPDTKPLKWYQIAANTEHLATVRKYRTAGKTADDYVKIEVLPKIAETEKMYFEKYGNLL